MLRKGLEFRVSGEKGLDIRICRDGLVYIRPLTGTRIFRQRNTFVEGFPKSVDDLRLRVSTLDPYFCNQYFHLFILNIKSRSLK